VNAIFDISWAMDDTKLITAAGDQTAKFWDVETKQLTSILMGHECSIKSLSVHHTNHSTLMIYIDIVLSLFDLFLQLLCSHLIIFQFLNQQ